MNLEKILVSPKLVPANYLELAQSSQKIKEKVIRELIEKQKLPKDGWPDDYIEELVHSISSLDSNNFPHKAGLGEREARIACKLVARRHYNFGHGIGRSGDLLEAQPKAAGSTLLSNLTNALLLDLIQSVGVRSCKSCFLVPMATGMTLTLCLLTLKKQRPNAKYVLWSRIDQKSCFKCITTAGLIPIIIDPLLNEDDELSTDIATFRMQLETLLPEVLCIFSTTSCFAPRNCDSLIELSEMAAHYDVPHLVNNAYGLQSTFLTHQLEQSIRVGRIDLFVQSTDKNLLVPVGGAIVAGFDAATVNSVAKTYAGRASVSQTLDVFMTLLSLGKSGYFNFVNERKHLFAYLCQELTKFAVERNFKVIVAKKNRISLALTLNSSRSQTKENLTLFGSMLYTRGISGVRVVAVGDQKEIDGYAFKNWGAHSEEIQVSYLTVATALGVTKSEIDTFIKKLRDCWKQFIAK